MERKKTYADLRKEEFDRHAQVARDIGDAALAQINEVLADEDRLLERLREDGYEGEALDQQLWEIRKEDQ